jgi:hypothetical protein
MAAPLMDKVLPPIVFLVGLMTAFILILIYMNPTIESNQQASNNSPSQISAMDYEKLLFTNDTFSWFTPDPFTVTPADRTTNYPLLLDSEMAVKFTNPAETSHPISMWVIAKHLGDYGGERYELMFKQAGGTLGLKTWYTIVDSTSWSVIQMNGTVVKALAVHVPLRHEYTVIVTPGPGSADAALSFMQYNYNITIGYKVGNQSTDPWVIVGQLFTFSLPGIPLFINALIMTPILITVGVVAYIVIRSVFPF